MTDSPLDALTINRLASVARTPLGEGSWVDLVSGFVRNAHDVMSAMHSATVWQQNETLRYDRYVPERRLSAGLRSQSQPLLHQTGMHLRATYGQPMEGVAAILYRTGEDFQGLNQPAAGILRDMYTPTAFGKRCSRCSSSLRSAAR